MIRGPCQFKNRREVLIDESPQRRIGGFLADAGHEALHVTDLDLLGASDDHVLAAALEDRRVLVTADTDFGNLLAISRDPFPSVILLRRPGRRPEQRAAAILSALEVVEARPWPPPRPRPRPPLRPKRLLPAVTSSTTATRKIRPGILYAITEP